MTKSVNASIIFSRNRRVTSGVRLKPLERIPTPYAYNNNGGAKKKLKKRRDRKRSNHEGYKILERAMADHQRSFSYSSDYEGFVDFSSYDEGFGSGRPGNVSDRLGTMVEEDEEALEDLKTEEKYPTKNLEYSWAHITQPIVSEILDDRKVISVFQVEKLVLTCISESLLETMAEQSLNN